MRAPDAFLESIRMYNRLSERCKLYKELSEKQDIMIGILKAKPTKSALVRYEKVRNKIQEIKKQIEDAKV